jgi:tRNA G10  N-methylase Trm11
MPVLSVIEDHVVTDRTNGKLIAYIAPLWLKSDDLVIDVTYGIGKWWTEYRPPGLITHDLATDGVDFRNLPESSNTVDVVVFDPPYVAKGGRETSGIEEMDERYGMKDAPSTPDDVSKLIYFGMMEAHRVLKPKGLLWVKCADYISSGKYYMGHFNLIADSLMLGFTQVDEYVHVTGTGPQPLTNIDGTDRRQVHSRRAHSFLVVLQK